MRKYLLLLFAVLFIVSCSTLPPERKVIWTDAAKPENLGTNVNTSDAEIGPIISQDGKKLYFTRNEYRDGGRTYDIWVSVADENGVFQKAVNIGKPINNEDNNFAVSLSTDENSLYVGNTYNPDGSPAESGLSLGRFDGSNWTVPQRVITTPPTNDPNQFSYCVAPSGNVILISADFQNKGQGKEDMYVVFKDENGKWSALRNLGRTLNTPNRDVTPYLAADMKTLYFASDGHGGYGELDIFVTRRLDDSWTKWSIPLNLGNKINTEDWDAYFTVPASGEYAYLVSTTNSVGEEDIFKIKLPNELKPDPVILISGRVLDKDSRTPIHAKIRYKVNGEEKEAGIAYSNPLTGEYKITLPAGAEYIFTATADDYVADTHSIDLTNDNKYREYTKDILLEKVKIPEPPDSIKIYGIVLDDKTGKPLEASIVFKAKGEVAPYEMVQSNPLTGEFSIVLPAQREYFCEAQADRYESYTGDIEKNNTEDKTIYKEIRLKKKPVDLSSLANAIQFDTGKHNIKKKVKPTLDKIAEILLEDESINLEIEGHTDDVGSDKGNLKLSIKRANSVLKYLISKGVNPNRLKANGYGESRPLLANITKENRAINRRVELINS